MIKIGIKPIYGYGWWRRDGVSQVPEPFELKIKTSNSNKESGFYSILFGVIEDIVHQYNGKWAILTARTLSVPATYNVLIYEKEPTVSPGSMTVIDGAEPGVTGFAEVASSL